MTDFKLPPISPEQYNILHTLRDFNVITESVAGSGKTTLALHTALAYTSSKFLIVTYNRALSQDCNEKIKQMKLESRVKCFTYHALMAKVCNQSCYNDVMFIDLLKNYIPTLSTLDFEFDSLIVDEMQDQRLHHFSFLTALLSRFKKKTCRFLFIGDPKQLLYDFYKTNPADERYLRLADELFKPFTDVKFKRICLSVSFRTTPRIAQFVNHVCKSEIVAGNYNVSDEKVKFVVCNPFKHDVVNYLYDIIREQGEDNVMFLSNTVTKSRSLQSIINALRERGINFFVSRNDYEQNSSQLLRKGKVVVETYCGVKGLERKCIFVFALGYTKETYSDKENQLYVALTRSCGGLLYIMHNYKFAAPWLMGINPNVIELKEFCSITGTQSDQNDTTTKNKLQKYEVNSILDFIDTTNLQEAVKWVKMEEFSPAQKSDFKSLVRFGKSVEDIRVIVKTALPMMAEYQATGKSVQVEWLLKPILAKDQNELNKLFELYGERVVLKSLYKKYFPVKKVTHIRNLYESKEKSLKEWLEIANATLCYQNYSHLLSQVKNYNWSHTIDLTHFQSVVAQAKPTCFRRPCIYLANEFTLKGQIDMVIENNLPFNFEFSAETTIEQVLKSALRMELAGYSTGYLYNIENKHLLQLSLITNDKHQLTKYIASCKISATQDSVNKQIQNDSHFLQNVFDLSQKIYK